MTSSTIRTEIGPVVNMGATQQCGSDCYPYTIIEVITNKKIVVQSDEAYPDHSRDFNYYGNQVYNYGTNPNGAKMTLTLRKNGRWLPVGQQISNGGCYANGFSIGHRRKYQNPSF